MVTPCLSNFWLTPPYCKTYDDSSDSEPEEFFNEENINYQPKVEVSNPSKLLNLIENLTDKSTKKLEVKLNLYLKAESESKFVFIVNINRITHEAIVQIMQQRALDPKCRVALSSQAIQDLHTYQIKPTTTVLHPQIEQLLQQVASGLGETIIVPVFVTEKKAEQESQFPAFIACLINSKKDSVFVSKLVSETFAYCSQLLLNTRSYEEQRTLKGLCQKLLLSGRNIFLRTENLNKLLKEIMYESRTLTNCERCTLYLISPDNMTMVAKAFDTLPTVNITTPVKISKDQGIPGYVAATGELLNIPNVEAHPLYVKGTEKFKTKNLLCCAVKYEDKIIGVMQLYNKINGEFDFYDESVLHAICIYCGIAITHGIDYQRITGVLKHHELTTNILVTNIHVTDQEVIDASMCPSAHDVRDFSNFQFPTRKILDKESPCFVIKMFHDLELIDECHIEIDHLAKFILYAKKSHLDLPYFNWQRTFGCIHFLFATIKYFQILDNGLLNKIDVLACLIACLCHDINYKGTPRSIAQVSDCLLANIYSSEECLMKRLQAAQALSIFNVPGCNFLANLPLKEYTRCLNLVKDLILATDLAMHYRIHARQLAMSLQGFDNSTPEHKLFLASLLMTCADLSEHTKDWTESMRSAQLVYTQFFANEKLQRKFLDATESNAALFNNVTDEAHKPKIPIPDLQIHFINECVICIFKILVTMFPAAVTLLQALQNNIICWEASKRIFNKMKLEDKTSIEILLSEELGIEVFAVIEALGKSQSVIETSKSQSVNLFKSETYV